MKVNDYIRTRRGEIAKIINLEKNPYGKKTIFVLDKEVEIYDLTMNDIYLMTNPLAEEKTNKLDKHFGDEKIITKSSKKIIDLIEVGDYVNGSQVVDIAQAPKKALYTEDIRQKGALIPIINSDIESIVTKEQFEEQKYKLR